MPIRRLLREGSFDPEEIEQLSTAYDATLELLRLQDRTDPVCELIATKILQIYRLGEHDPSRVCARAVKELGIPMPE